MFQVTLSKVTGLNAREESLEEAEVPNLAVSLLVLDFLLVNLFIRYRWRNSRLGSLAAAEEFNIAL